MLRQMGEAGAPTPPPTGRFPDAPSPTHAAIISDPLRLASLHDTGLLDTLPEEAFDRLTRLASRLLGAPVSLLSLVDDRRQFFKSQIGLDGPVAIARETPLSHSFCQYVVSEDTGLAVSDARTHPLLSSNGAVADLSVIAYLGEPIHAPDGSVIGSLCAIDSTPHDWSALDRTTMRDLAAMLESQLDLKLQTLKTDLVLGEMHHRIKNLFTVSGSLLRTSAREAASIDDLVAAFEGRMNALSQSHSLAIGTSSNGAGADPDTVTLGQIVDQTLAPFANSPGVAVHTDGPDIPISPKSMTYLALSLHELATNAAKYGGLRGDGGSVRVEWRVDPGTGAILLNWTETGVLDSDDATGFGSDLLGNAIMFGLAGTYDRHWDRAGISYAIRLPAEALA